MATLIETRNVCKDFKRPERTIEVLKDINLKIPEGKFVALTGQSGCGKTTLLQLLGLLDKPTSGDIFFRGGNISELGIMDKAQFRLNQIGFIFQSYQLLPELSSLENIVLAGQLGKKRMSDVRSRAKSLLEVVHMDQRAKHRPQELSGGEQQRIAIARSLMNEPEVILADEPTGNLDPENSHGIMKLLQDLRDDHNKTVLMVTHNHKLAEYADIIYTLEEGQLKKSRKTG